MNLDIKETFKLFSQLEKDPSGCWIWRGKTFKGGYGKLFLRGKLVKAHRIMWQVANKQSLTPEIFVCHHCDTPSCCNPEHLFAGTAKDNRADQDRKGRHCHGEAVNTNKLTKVQVLEIRDRWSKTEKKYGFCSQVGREYGVSDTQIGNIVRGETWKHLL